MLVGCEAISMVTYTIKSMSMFRGVRLLKFLKLFRLYRVEVLVAKVEMAISSNILSLCIRIFKHVFALATCNHLLSCFWYGIGASAGGWVDHYLTGADLSYRYVSAAHWAIANF